MKFLLAVFVYLVMAVLIGWGIYAMMHGAKPWLLIVSVAAYLVVAAKKGCLDSH